MQGTTMRWMEPMALRPQQSLGAVYTGSTNRNSFGAESFDFDTLSRDFNTLSRERNNGKIIRACDTEATPGGGVQYHKCYDQDGGMANTILMRLFLTRTDF